jgi:hypothetical protein
VRSFEFPRLLRLTVLRAFGIGLRWSEAAWAVYPQAATTPRRKRAVATASASSPILTAVDTNTSHAAEKGAQSAGVAFARVVTAAAGTRVMTAV